jgi:peptidoglycan/xylan/chitin deacetylase (PgdA/CDA1 family)
MYIDNTNGNGNVKQINNVKVLMYHKIVDDERTSRLHWTNVGKEQFRKQLMLLDKFGFTPITFRDYLLSAKGELRLPKKPVILTFDDGYEVVYKIAFPIIKEMGWNAVVFVLGDQSIRTAVWDNKFDPLNNTLLSPDQIIEMHEAGFEIGSHSMTHQFLPTESYPKASYEIERSKQKLELLIASDVLSFCYPYGAVNAQLKQLVEDTGYSIGCGVYTGYPKFGKDNYDIRRLTINNNTNAVSFSLKLLTPFEYYEYLGSKILHGNRRNQRLEKIEFKVSKPVKMKTDGTHVNV